MPHFGNGFMIADQWRGGPTAGGRVVADKPATFAQAPNSTNTSGLTLPVENLTSTSGNVAGTGTFRCTDCDYAVSLDAVDELPTCPNCNGTSFVRASLFTTAQTAVVDVTPEAEDRGWLDEAVRRIVVS